MARQKKSIQVSTFEHRRSGLSVPIFYDPNRDRNVHHAAVGTDTFEHASLGEVERQLTAYLGNLNFDWLPVIRVDHFKVVAWHNNAGQKAGFTIDIERFYAAVAPDGNMRKVGWDVPPERRTLDAHGFFWKDYEHRDEPAMFAPPFCVKNHSGHTHYLPYTDQLWQGITQLRDALRILESRLENLLATTEGLDQISRDGGKLLLHSPGESELR